MTARAFPAEPDLTPREAAELSGVSVKTVLRQIKLGALRAYRRPGNRLAIRRDDFCIWAYGSPVTPTERPDVEDPPPRRQRRRAETGSVADLLEIERRRGVA